MIHELAALGDLRLQDFRVSEPVSSQSDLDAFSTMLTASIRKLPKLYSGELHKRFSHDFPIRTESIRALVARELFGRYSSDIPVLVDLDSIKGVPQRNGSDCVGAAYLSVVSSITGIEITDAVYETFLIKAEESGLAHREPAGVKVEPFIFNTLMTPKFRKTYPADITVAHRRDLTTGEISRIARAAKKQKYNLYVLPSLNSEHIRDCGHIVGIQKIEPESITVYDPKYGTNRSMNNEEFRKRWKYDNNNAIFVFAEK